MAWVRTSFTALSQMRSAAQMTVIPAAVSAIVIRIAVSCRPIGGPAIASGGRSGLRPNCVLSELSRAYAGQGPHAEAIRCGRARHDQLTGRLGVPVCHAFVETDMVRVRADPGVALDPVLGAGRYLLTDNCRERFARLGNAPFL